MGACRLGNKVTQAPVRHMKRNRTPTSSQPTAITSRIGTRPDSVRWYGLLGMKVFHMPRLPRTLVSRNVANRRLNTMANSPSRTPKRPKTRSSVGKTLLHLLPRFDWVFVRMSAALRA
jgi:hypothetical protein